MGIAFTIIALILALGATVVAFIFIVPEKKREKLNKIGKLLHDIFNFKFLIVEKILQALYILCTAFAVIYGFFMLFSFETYSYGYYIERTTVRWNGGWGLLIMIGGPIAIRLAYEGMMMMILLVKNVIQINNKLKAPEGENAENADIFGVELPFSAPKKEEEAADELHTTLMSESIDLDRFAKQPEVKIPAATFCPHCGAKVDGGLFCSVCGKKL